MLAYFLLFPLGVHSGSCVNMERGGLEEWVKFKGSPLPLPHLEAPSLTRRNLALSPSNLVHPSLIPPLHLLSKFLSLKGTKLLGLSGPVTLGRE